MRRKGTRKSCLLQMMGGGYSKVSKDSEIPQCSLLPWLGLRAFDFTASQLNLLQLW